MTNLVIGSNSLVGKSLSKIIEAKKLNNFYFISMSNITNKNYIKLNLNNGFKNIKFKNINKCFFLSSPRYVKKNFKKKIYNQEFIWVKNLVDKFKIKKLIYLSSSTIYQKDHFIGCNKIKAERLLNKSKNQIQYIQIWRPFNLIGYNQSKMSDHFHNKLFKIIFINKKRFYLFNGNGEDKRGYSSVDDFTKICFNYSNKNKNFVKNYGNPNLISISEMIKIYNKICKKYYGYYFIPYFKSIKSNHNSVRKLNINKTVYSKKTSKNVIHKFLKHMIIKHKIKPKKIFK